MSAFVFGRKPKHRYGKKRIQKERDKIYDRMRQINAYTRQFLDEETDVPARRSMPFEVKFPYDLRLSLEEKVIDAQEDGWTVFLNNAGNLAHIVHSDGFHVRVPVRPSLKRCHTGFIAGYFENFMHGRFIL